MLEREVWGKVKRPCKSRWWETVRDVCKSDGLEEYYRKKGRRSHTHRPELDCLPESKKYHYDVGVKEEVVVIL